MFSKLFAKNRQEQAHDFVTLYTTFGSCISKPTSRDFKSALSELFRKSDEEHFNSWIECGFENGTLEVLDIYAGGYAIYTKYSDVDMTEELESYRIENVSKKTALSLWQKLISGNWEV